MAKYINLNLKNIKQLNRVVKYVAIFIVYHQKALLLKIIFRFFPNISIYITITKLKTKTFAVQYVYLKNLG